jgi:hypothetical protein
MICFLFAHRAVWVASSHFDPEQFLGISVGDILQHALADHATVLQILQKL